MSTEYNMGMERLLSQSTTSAANYVGSMSSRLVVAGYYNTALTPGSGSPQSRAPYSYIAPTFWARSVGRENYNALQVSLIRRYTNGFTYQVAYTWSKNINAGDDGWNFAEGSFCQDPYDLTGYGCRGVAGNDLKHFLSTNLLYQVPVGKGRALSTGNSALDYILGNWQANGIFLAHSGIPFYPRISSDIANTGNYAVSTNPYEAANL